MDILQVICAILVQDGKVLVAQRSESMSLPLKWEFPGGKKMAYETNEDCLQREIKEELGADIAVLTQFASNVHHYSGFSINLTAYFAKHISGILNPIEHCQIKWLKPYELLSLDWADADVPIVINLLSSNYLINQ